MRMRNYVHITYVQLHNKHTTTFYTYVADKGPSISR